ncbi:hypothetical protein U5897_08145 [Acinetobacter baumannii]|uniref:hypothetical protein n=1 Tax=Acinetobacter baumannii TaxID=470 RepID=UPI002DDCC475|nr:hypothetical protein [Acinetobacter baumannii]WSI14997.1 hypothetical protein U5897_08145 [Acinetobacter baumannii]
MNMDIYSATPPVAKKRRKYSKMSALCAVMRKLVYLCYGVLKNKTPYQPDYA